MATDHYSSTTKEHLLTTANILSRAREKNGAKMFSVRKKKNANLVIKNGS